MRTAEQEAKFKQERSLGVGASDAAALLGLSPWKTPLQLFAEKVGHELPVSAEQRERFKWGHRLEPVVAQTFAEETGREIVHDEEMFVQHPDMHHMIAHLDRVFRFEDDDEGALECKKTEVYKRSDWGVLNNPGEPIAHEIVNGKRVALPNASEIPLNYQVQVQHQLAVSGYPRGSIAVMIGNSEFAFADVARNQTFIDALMTKIDEFWEYVIKGEMPSYDPQHQDASTLGYLFDKYDCGQTTLDHDALGLVEKIHQMEEIKTCAEHTIDESKARLMMMLGVHTSGVLPNGKIVKFKNESRKDRLCKCGECVQRGWKKRVLRVPRRPKE